MTLPILTKRLSKLAADNSPAILTAIGVAGVLSTAYLAARGAFKSARVLDENESSLHPLEPKQKFDLVWKNYIPASIAGALTVAAIVSASRVSSRRAAALAVVYTVSEKAFEEYRSKIVEKIGPKKEQSFRDEIAQEQVAQNPVNNCEVIFAGSGGDLYHDAFSGRYFTSDMQTVRKAQNDLNQQILSDSYASLSDFYELLGIRKTGVSDEVGWTTDRLLDIKFSTVLTEDDRPCMSINFSVQPTRNFNRFS